jgi:prophage regulatory protein
MITNTLRLPSLIQKIGISRSGIYQHVEEGLLPPQIKIGERSVIWLNDEIEQVLSARIKGRTSAEIKKLVSKIVSDRSKL